MDIAPKYEDLVAYLEASNRLCDSLSLSMKNHRHELGLSMARESALREEVEVQRRHFKAQLQGAKDADVLQQRLTVAEQRAFDLEKDRARLDYIQKNWVSIRCNVKNTGFCGPTGKEFEAYIYAAGANDKKPGEGETIRQAIDNMAETNGAALKPAAEGEGS